MKTETINKIKQILDRVYDIVTVQLIGAVIFILIALTIKFVGGDVYNSARELYYSAVNSIIDAKVVIDDNNLIEDETYHEKEFTSSNNINTEDETSNQTLTEVTINTSNACVKKYIWPLNGKITSNYGDVSKLFSGPDSSHTGIDIASNTGTPIKSVESGIVEFSGYSSGFGNYIIIKHDDKIMSLYAHCSELLYKKGASINKGDVIALVGSSGKATGSHLHLEFINNGKSIDPLWLLPSLSNI